MKMGDGRSSWVAFGLFYTTLIGIVSLLDNVNNVLTLYYWSAQVGLITVGVGLFALIGIRLSNLSAAIGLPLAFTVGILTIIPAVLMSLGRIPGLWSQYFYIAFGMAAGIFLTFLFVRFSQKLIAKDQPELERDTFD